MLKNLVIPADYTTSSNLRCGEIFCENFNNVTLLCTFCQMKTFTLDDFLQHYKNAHFTKSNGVTKKFTQNVKCETQNLNKFKQEQIIGDKGELSAADDSRIEPEESYWSCEPRDENVKLRRGAHGVEFEVALKMKNGEHNDAGTSSKSGFMSSENEIDEADDDDTNADDKEDEAFGILKKPPKPKAPPLTCDYCPKTCSTRVRLNQHIKLKHLRPKLYKCDDCQEEFAEERSLQAHNRKKHLQHTCEFCGKVLKTMRSLRYHKLTHSDVRFACEVENCGKTFVTARLLKNHKTTHGIGCTFICETCGYRTGVKGNLTVHIRSHTGERPYVCSQCGKGFTSKSLLNEHMSSHSSERPHKCGICGAAFNRPKALYHHKHLHSGKKFECKICGKAYAQMAGLSAHKMQHKMEMQV